VTHLRRVPDEKILLARVEEQERQLARALSVTTKPVSVSGLNERAAGGV
jgi:hypothetical protein